ncbi:SCO1860 family LAETG-anchored protein [Streptomyces pinistramenti]|uniref:SCO1860 family LAETG-anchored protein n=1 Tax=Streptomyces pinistramenti TaxID=2884812 RepID=UPI001D0921F8|nr:SCO1860 family LAETG-anchored protein [Streptomyces pinistramenti]MCB5907296.1 LPXTG cell wall anchor domain-containing protein [Streptomyces pinistramenti]
MSTSSTGPSGMPVHPRPTGPEAPAARRSVRRFAAACVATALTAGPVLLLGAGSAHAAEGHGASGAAVLRTNLDVGLLNKAVNVPLHVALNDVHAPADADKTALSVDLDGVDHGKPFSVLSADVATARATAEAKKAEGYSNLAHAKVHVPGLPLLSLIEVEKVTSRAVCEAGKRPVASSNVLGTVKVLGKTVTLTAGGTTEVKVPGVGDVRLDLSKKSVTSATAAATALDLKVAINPLKLNVAEVNGHVQLADATCTTPGGKGEGETGGTTGGNSGGATSGGQDGGQTGGQTGGQNGGQSGGGSDGGASGGGKGSDANAGTGSGDKNLAETGSSSTTPYLAGGAALLLVAGAGSLGYARKRKAAAQQGDRG